MKGMAAPETWGNALLAFLSPCASHANDAASTASPQIVTASLPYPKYLECSAKEESEKWTRIHGTEWLPGPRVRESGKFDTMQAAVRTADLYAAANRCLCEVVSTAGAEGVARIAISDVFPAASSLPPVLATRVPNVPIRPLIGDDMLYLDSLQAHTGVGNRGAASRIPVSVRSAAAPPVFAPPPSFSAGDCQLHSDERILRAAPGPEPHSRTRLHRDSPTLATPFRNSARHRRFNGVNDFSRSLERRGTYLLCGLARLCVLLPLLSLLCTASPLQTQELVLGLSHTCALLQGGGVSCWGSNSAGQLGRTGLLSPSLLSPPAPIYFSPPTLALGAGGWTTCAVVRGGGLSCWGSNAAGQYSAELSTDNPVPSDSSLWVDVLADSLSTGSSNGFMCWIMLDGALRCNGDNTFGQLGIGPSFSSYVIANASSVSLGLAHACALLSDSTVRCWGDNHRGQLGRGTFSAPSVDPSAGPAVLRNVAKLTSGDYFTCALHQSGATLCWGANDAGQLGISSWVDSAVPYLALPASMPSLSIAAGSAHMCALLAGSYSVKCWGNGSSGQLGYGVSSSLNSPPPGVVLSGVRGLSAGGAHTCALMDSGGFRCWGANEAGQLGNGNSTSLLSPPSTDQFVLGPPPFFSYVPVIAACVSVAVVAGLASLLVWHMKRTKNMLGAVSPIDTREPGLEDIVDVEDPLPPLQPMMQQDDNKSETMTGQLSRSTLRSLATPAHFPHYSMRSNIHMTSASTERMTARTRSEQRMSQQNAPTPRHTQSFLRLEASPALPQPTVSSRYLRKRNGSESEEEDYGDGVETLYVDPDAPKDPTGLATPPLPKPGGDLDRLGDLTGFGSFRAAKNRSYNDLRGRMRMTRSMPRHLNLAAAAAADQGAGGAGGEGSTEFLSTNPQIMLRVLRPKHKKCPSSGVVMPKWAPQSFYAAIESALFSESPVCAADFEFVSLLSCENGTATFSAKCVMSGHPKPNKIYEVKVAIPHSSNSTLISELVVYSALEIRSHLQWLWCAFTDAMPPSAVALLPDNIRESIADAKLLDRTGGIVNWAVFQPCPVPLASLAMPSSSSPTTSPSSPPPLPFSVFAPLATRVFEAALFLQEQNVLHRDFTLENLRVVEGQHSLTITNFGEAVVLSEAARLVTVRRGARQGNATHTAPEILSLLASLTNPVITSVLVNYGGQASFEVGVLLCSLLWAGKHPLGDYPRAYTLPRSGAVTYGEESIMCGWGEALGPSYPPALLSLLRGLLSPLAQGRTPLARAAAEFARLAGAEGWKEEERKGEERKEEAEDDDEAVPVDESNLFL